MNVPDEFYHQLLEKIEPYSTISTIFKIKLREVLQIVHYKRGTRIQNTNQIPDQLWFLVSGLVKEIYVNPVGFEEWATWFWYPSDFMYTEPGLFNKTPSDSYIELITDACLIHIPYSDCMALQEVFPEASMLVKVMRGEYASLRKLHQVAMATTADKENFKKLREAHPELFREAKHKDILEFLGSRLDSFRGFSK